MARFFDKDLINKELTMEEKINDIKERISDENIEISPDDIGKMKDFMKENNLNTQEDLINFLHENKDNFFDSDNQTDDQNIIHKTDWRAVGEKTKSFLELCFMATTFYSGGVKAIDNINNYQPQTEYVQESGNLIEMLDDFEKNNISISSDKGQVTIESGISGDKYVIGENATIMPQEIVVDESLKENNVSIDSQENIDNLELDYRNEVDESLIEVNQDNNREIEKPSLFEECLGFVSGGVMGIAGEAEEEYMLERYDGRISTEDVLEYIENPDSSKDSDDDIETNELPVSGGNDDDILVLEECNDSKLSQDFTNDNESDSENDDN